MVETYSPGSIVVGIDGSRAAIGAATWAVHEVADSDIPLRLVHVATPNPFANRREKTRALAAAEEIMHDACSAIDAVDQPIKVETDIIVGQPVSTLVRASRSAILLCVGDTGPDQRHHGLIGSAAASLVDAADCSVAAIRDQHQAAAPQHGSSIVAWINDLDDDAEVLQKAIHEAQRRSAPLVVVTSRGPQRLPQYPDVDIHVVLTAGSLLDYLAENASSIGLLVVGATHSDDVRQLVGRAGAAALGGSGLSLFIVRSFGRLAHPPSQGPIPARTGTNGSSRSHGRSIPLVAVGHALRTMRS